MAVTRRARCVVCKQKHPQMQGHHVIPQEVLRREFPYGAVLLEGEDQWIAVGRLDVPEDVDGVYRTLQEILWDKRNGVPVCPRDHQRHTDAVARIPILALPVGAFLFARELNLEHRLGPRYYAG